MPELRVPVTLKNRRQPWLALAGFALLGNFAWEMLQAPFYRGMPEAAHWAAVVECGRATVGDVFITLLAYAAAIPWGGGRWWLGIPRWKPVGVYLAAGLGIMLILELVNVYGLGRWTYAERMPLVLGVGLTPVLQWVLMPPLALWLARRHLSL